MNQCNGLKLLLSAGLGVLRILLVICAILWIGVHTASWWEAKNAYWIPDVAVRAEARQMDIRDIEYIRLQGYNVGYGKDSSQDITNPEMIAGFLETLRNADMKKPGPILEPDVSDKCDTFEIHFRDRAAWVVPTVFSIPEDCFGPPFQKALAALGKYRANQMRTLLHDRGTHLKKVTIQSDEACDVATKVFQKREELKSITGELNALDENAFAYANMDRTMGVQFTFDDGKKQNVYLVLRDLKSYPSDEQPKTWPPTINSYLLQLEKQCRH